MGIASGVFVPPSPTRDVAAVTAPGTMLSAHLCGIGCEVAQGSPVGLLAIAMCAVAAWIAYRRWRMGRR